MPANTRVEVQAVFSGEWQQWNAAAGKWWSSRAANDQPNQSVLLTWTEVKAAYPDAVVGGYGVNLGSCNPGQTTATDGLVFGSSNLGQAVWQT